MRRHRGRLLTQPVLALGLYVLVLVAGCDRDSSTSPACPEYRIGAIEGYIRAGGIPARAQLRANPLGSDDDRRFRVETDSTGWYRMELPTGAYRLPIYPPNASIGSSYLSNDQDTVRVTTSVRRFDLNEGSLEVRVTVPSILEGRTLRCGIDGHSNAVRSQSAQVHSGVLAYSFPLVHTGEYKIELRLSGANLWLPGTWDRNHAESVVVGADAPTPYEADLSALSGIAGSVHGSSQQMDIGPPEVRAFNADSASVGSVSPSLDGAFVLDVFPAQPVRLLVNSRWRGGGFWVGGDSFETATQYDLRAGEQIAGVEILESGILCHLDWPDRDTQYLANLLLVDAQGHEIHGGTGSPSGGVGINALAPGRYFLRLEHVCGVRWAPSWYNGAESLADATPIDVAGTGELVEITMPLQEGGRINGTILPHSGGTLGDHTVALCDTMGNQICRSYAGDASSGAFHFQGLDNGDYKAAVEGALGLLWWYPGTADPDSAGTITIADHAAVSGIEWRLPQ